MFEENETQYCKNCFDLTQKLQEKEQECDNLTSQLDFAVQQKECLEQECEELKDKNKRHEQVIEMVKEEMRKGIIFEKILSIINKGGVNGNT